MSTNQTTNDAYFESKIKEAEVYHSMGLLEESLGIYKEISSNISKTNPKKTAELNNKIETIQKEIEEARGLEDEDVKKLASQKETIKDQLLGGDNAEEIVTSASALKELGLLEDAIAEYEKLFEMDYPITKVIPELVDCLLKINSPSDVVDRIDTLIEKRKPEPSEKAQGKFCLGLEMEKRAHKEIALECYKSAQKFDAANKEIKRKLDAFLSKIPAGSRYDYLINKGLVTTGQLQKALAISKKRRSSVEFALIDQYNVNKQEIGKSLSHFYGCPFKSFDPTIPVPAELIGKLKKSFLLHDVWVPLSWGKDGVAILLDDPKDLRKTDQIRSLLKTGKINYSVGIKEDIEQYIKHFFDDAAPKQQEDIIDELDIIPDISFEEDEEPDYDESEFLDEASSQVVKLVDQFMVTAYRGNISDIHIEPSPISKKTSIRFRLDGVCQNYVQVPLSMSRGILSRLKIMAGLDIAERRLPQDGKIKFKRKGIPAFELRLSTMPTAGGFEDAVMRILAKAGAMKLDEMGLNERNLGILKKIVTTPYGLVLAVGPTGSGKTTTLHAALGHINQPGVKIWTAEDPVEITQPGLRQVEIKRQIGLDFARIMRGFLRLDPDVIMIGEMRDKETASIGIEASLTGHLVFSTLHTNSAPETLTRLLDMGLNPLNFSDAFLGVLAQRLVRRLCPECAEEYNPSKEEFGDIVASYGKKEFKSLGIEYSTDLKLYKAKGCDVCSGTGYKGRMGIHELLEGTPAIKRMIKNEANTEEIFEQGAKEGMTTLKQDGIHKVFMGLTDLSEVKRVCVD
jgi:type II secretory ATPase GspE/PulE/Tfp pilus assembly ATPase PilB-like protein